MAIDSSVLMFSYMFLYNITMLLLFWTLFTIKISSFKTLYSFSSLGYYSYQLVTLTILLFSMAGVPPFIGFFSKLFILTLLTNSTLYLLYYLFFPTLFIGLYFYTQNIRFLHTTSVGDRGSIHIFTERLSISYYYFSVNIISILILGLFFIDDILLVFTWLLF